MGKLTMTEKKCLSKYRSRFLGWSLELVQTLFHMLLITYLFLLISETILKGSVSSYFNLNHWLIVVIIVGVVAVLTASSKAESVERGRLTFKSIFIIICAGIGGAAIIWYKIQDVGWLAYFIAVASGALIILLSVLSSRESIEEVNEKGTS